MKFALQINSSAHESNAGLIACQLIEAALIQGHQIIQVFFYHDGVYHALRYATLPDDEANIRIRWQALAQQGVDLVVCVSAAQRRGLLCDDEARRQGKLDNDLADGFRIGGLGQWMAATLEADRIIVLG